MPWLFLLAYTSSGLAGLVYEVTWTRYLTLYLGHTTAAASAVVAAFLGGLAVGEPQETMLRILESTTPLLPADKPRYLMGVGTPEDIVAGVAAGVDMFDCVLPTRNARNGMLFTTKGIINIRNEKWKDDLTPIDPDLGGYASVFHSKAYLGT